MDPDQDKNRRQILYPMAYGVPHLLTHISDAKTGEKYLCPGCSKDMVPRKGDIKRHHFAHKASQDRCDSDNALHETAKEAIRQGFLKAQDQNSEARRAEGTSPPVQENQMPNSKTAARLRIAR